MRNVECGEGDPSLGKAKRIFLNFPIKMKGFVHFYCEKLFVTKNWERAA